MIGVICVCVGVCAFALLLVDNAQAGITFTGDVGIDFPSAAVAVRVIVDPMDVGLPPRFSQPSGWDVQSLRFEYDEDVDTLSIGVDCFGICGDADGDGDPAGASAALVMTGGFDVARLSQAETIAVALDVGVEGVSLTPDGTFDFVVGVMAENPPENMAELPPACRVFALNTTCAGIYRVASNAAIPSLGTSFRVRVNDPLRALMTTTMGPEPSAATPDFEIAVLQFGQLLGAFSGSLMSSSSPWAMRIGAFAGSFIDDGFGEDRVPNTGSNAYETFPCTDEIRCSVLALSSVGPLEIPVGTSAVLTVALKIAPTAPVTVTISSNAVDVVLSANELTFTAANFATAQQLQLTPTTDVRFTISLVSNSDDKSFDGIVAEVDGSTTVDLEITLTSRVVYTLAGGSIVDITFAGQQQINPDLITVTSIIAATIDGVDQLPLSFVSAVEGTTPFLALSATEADLRACEFEDCNPGGNFFTILTAMLRRRATGIVFQAPQVNGGAAVPVEQAVAVGIEVDQLPPEMVEGGDQRTISVALVSAPTAPVTIAFASSDNTELTLSPATLTFSGSNFAVPQRIKATAARDFIVDGTQTAQVTVSVSSADVNYNAITVAPQQVNILDNGEQPSVAKQQLQSSTGVLEFCTVSGVILPASDCAAQQKRAPTGFMRIELTFQVQFKRRSKDESDHCGPNVALTVDGQVQWRNPIKSGFTRFSSSGVVSAVAFVDVADGLHRVELNVSAQNCRHTLFIAHTVIQCVKSDDIDAVNGIQLLDSSTSTASSS